MMETNYTRLILNAGPKLIEGIGIIGMISGYANGSPGQCFAAGAFYLGGRWLDNITRDNRISELERALETEKKLLNSERQLTDTVYLEI